MLIKEKEYLNMFKSEVIVMWQYQNTDELYHHGVLGMKWGVRRYQNANGTLTSIGKKRYGTSDTVKNIQNKKDAIKKRKNSYLGKESERVDKVFDKTYARDLNYLTKNGMRKGKAERIVWQKINWWSRSHPWMWILPNGTPMWSRRRSWWTTPG